jgi:predicted aspartyl protease
MPEIIFTQEYNRRDFSPPMPVLDVGVSKPGADVPVRIIEAIIDTGADGTLLPRDILKHAGAPYIDRVHLVSITGERRPVDLYVVTLHLGERRVHGVQAVALPAGATAILGRDVLNQLRLHLDGLAGATEVVE